MSFDLFLERLVSGESAEADRARVLRLVRQQCQSSENPFGFYLLRFADGTHAEFQAKGLESDHKFTGCGFHLRAFGPDILTFIFELAVAADMVIFNAQGRDSPERPLAILIDPSQRTHLPPTAAINPVLCTSPRHLSELLGISYVEWSTFRDAAIGKSGAE